MPKRYSDEELIAIYDNPLEMSELVAGIRISSGAEVTNKQKLTFNGIPAWEFTAVQKPVPPGVVIKSLLFYKNRREFSIQYLDINEYRETIKETLETFF